MNDSPLNSVLSSRSQYRSLASSIIVIAHIQVDMAYKHRSGFPGRRRYR
ncbi:hypothetical protein LTSEWAN_3692, partial [Salmonella enterica subsp. enterica serovar Wandsworth str. A4-580]